MYTQSPPEAPMQSPFIAARQADPAQVHLTPPLVATPHITLVARGLKKRRSTDGPPDVMYGSVDCRGVTRFLLFGTAPSRAFRGRHRSSTSLCCTRSAIFPRRNTSRRLDDCAEPPIQTSSASSCPQSEDRCEALCRLKSKRNRPSVFVHRLLSPPTFSLPLPHS